ncbi:MAG: acetyl-CoA carboxylase carboxyl transferase subunit beta, partial [Flavobacteriales bacterium]|nr:acetyl-CoA carboxylase carboxyl transferase subunit beta [Flavobacteriales bacterium]
MGWFKRIKSGITTRSQDKKEIPEGLWYNCPKCKHLVPTEEHAETYWVCAKCEHHERIGSHEYFAILFDEGKHRELNKDLVSADPLKFKDTKKYTDRIAKTQKSSGLKDAIRTASGKLHGEDVVIACMDFRFIGGSM